MSKKKNDEKLSKKARKALAEREAEIAAELKRREKIKAKSKKKPSKKGKKAKPVETIPTVEPMTFTATPEAPIDVAPEVVEAVVERAKPLKGKALKAALEADLAAAAARRAADEETDAEIKARVQAKRAAREAAAASAADTPGSPERLADMAVKVKKGKAERAEAAAIEKTAEAVEAIRQAVEVVETEHGREFAVGESVTTDAPEEFGKPSDAPAELESGRNGYKIIQLDTDGKPDPRKIRQMTRVTTFVGNIDDETAIRDWEKRLLALGLANNALGDDDAAIWIAQIRDHAHRRDVAIAKAHKADRKGKLGIGEVAHLVKDAEKAFKDAVNVIVDEALEAAGRNAKADAGTNLHMLAETRDAQGVEAVRKMHEEDLVTATELASIEAYDARMTRLGAKVIEAEAVVVNDEMGYAGRLDRVLMCKLPELVIGRGTPGEYVRPADVRSKRYVADIKSGSLEYGAGKIARQMTAYAHGRLYNVETGERTRHSAATDVGLVFHLPQGEGVCHVYAVDLKSGLALLKLSAEVRRARNTGKKTIDLTVDIADPEPGE